MTAFADMMAAQWPCLLASFGEPVTLTVAGSPEAVTGIFNSSLLDLGIVPGSEDEMDSAIVRVSTASVINVGDTVSVRGLVYSITKVEKPDGGVYRLTVRRVETSVAGRGRREIR